MVTECESNSELNLETVNVIGERKCEAFTKVDTGSVIC